MARTENEDREGRILDAAAQLIAHFGYDKTTVSDIAHEAGISKGAVYLHFESKEALFEALLIREMMTYALNWLAQLEKDEAGGTLGGMYKSMLYALSDNPFMAALFRQDRHILGNYVRKPDNFFKRFQEGQSSSTRFEFVHRMQAAGALRDDLDPQVITHIMNMLAYGLVSMDGVIPAEETPELDDLIEGIAFMMDRALMSPDPTKADIGKQIVREIVAEAHQRYEQLEKPEQEQTEQ